MFSAACGSSLIAAAPPVALSFYFQDSAHLSQPSGRALINVELGHREGAVAGEVALARESFELRLSEAAFSQR